MVKEHTVSVNIIRRCGIVLHLMLCIPAPMPGFTIRSRVIYPIVDKVIKKTVYIIHLLLPEKNSIFDSLGLDGKGNFRIIRKPRYVPPCLIPVFLLCRHTLLKRAEVLFQLSSILSRMSSAVDISVIYISTTKLPFDISAVT